MRRLCIAPPLAVAALTALTAIAATDGAAQAIGRDAVRWVPERPVQGALIRVEVARLAVHSSPLTGTMAGEPLHFDTTGGWLSAIAAIPMDTRDSIVLTLLHSNGDSDRIAIPVGRGAYGSERLTVAPNMARPPDSATVRRIADENAKALAIAQASHETTRFWRPPFVAPRASRVTDNYGRARVYNGIVESRHFGTDYAGAVGAPVRATNAGVVALVADFYLAGKVLYIDHGGGLVTGYFHLSGVSVAAGDTVRTGQVVARVGKSGRVTGPHLHWSVRYGAVSVDPQSLLKVGGR